MAKNRGGTHPPSGGSLVGGGAPTPPAPARTGKGKTIDRLLSMLSIWPFRNKAFVRSLETAQEVVEKQNKLEETIIQHGRTRGRLNDLGLTVAQDRLQRRREFIEERSRASTALNDFMLEGEMMDSKNKLRMEEIKRQQKEQKIQRMEQEKREALLAKELEELRKSPPEPAKKRREEVITKYEREIARIEASKKTEKAKATLKKAAEAEKEEELQKIENMP